ncbi:MAG: hypothetical protein IJI45_18060 [Anaerolineaceae bacterium]|nr:hypothetical protein [Anaerolineaceae bacterium]
MMNMIFDILKWYFVLTGFGLIGLPIVFGFLKKLPGRGFVFARSLGLILTSYVYWLLGSLGFLRNNIGSLLLVILVFVGLAVFAWIKQKNEIGEWFRNSLGYVIASELVFLLGFILVITLRLGGPEVSGTEKPMEMMFINSILKSETFPPRDGWLSGYSISYYYFGYIMSAVLVMLSGVASSVGFNLMLAAVFGLAAESAFGILNDLLELRHPTAESILRPKLRSLLAPLFVLIAGNLEGLLEVFHSLHLFWNADGTSAFWSWLDLKELSEFPVRLATWNPTGRSGIWWWRASRVVSDSGLEGSVKEVIDEFPMFSFELGDLHPHVLAIPFVLFAVGIALNALVRSVSERKERCFFAEGLIREDLTLRSTDMIRWIRSADFWLTSVCVGALLFLNMWDFPFYFGLYCLCVTAAQVRNFGWNRKAFTVFFETALPFGAACILLYSLFFVSFASQAGGIVPSGVFATRTVQFLIMFGFFLVPIICWQFFRMKDCGKTSKRFGCTSALTIFGVLVLLECIIYIGLILIRTRVTGGSLGIAAESFTSMQQITSVESGLSGFFSRRFWALPTLVILFLMAGLSFSLIRQTAGNNISEEKGPSHQIDVFCSLMILIAAALVIFPEFFYLRDLFGTRMNTIFKFYYQAWILFGLSAAYAVSELISGLQGLKRAVFSFVMILLSVSVLVYPFFCITGKWGSLSMKQNPTLDGADFLRYSRNNDWQGLEWLRTAEPGVVLEKVGNSYGGDNIVSTFIGLPSVLGPAGHESQWRGGYDEIGSRSDDVKRIYETHSWETASELLETYKIRYIFLGSAEKSAYNIQDKKFERNLTKVFDSGNCTIYQVY